MFKSSQWHYEHEWRLLRFCKEPSKDDKKNKNGTFMTGHATEIYLGCRMDPKCIELIDKAVDEINSARRKEKKKQLGPITTTQLDIKNIANTPEYKLNITYKY